MTTTAIISVPHQLLLVPKQYPCSQISLSKSSFNLRCSSSSSSSSSPSPVIEDEGSASQSESDPPFPLSGCKACGKGEIESGCNGEGRIQGGIATVPGFGWWPIKAYRPCPEFVASGGRYRRQGQSMDEVAGFGRVEKAASMRVSDEPQSSKKKQGAKKIKK